MLENKKEFKLITKKNPKSLLPNALTIFGVCLGLSSIKFALDTNYAMAIIAIGLAAILDTLDGRVARLIRGTTSVKIIKMLYESGAKEVHLRIASPPIKYPDYYGVDTPNKNELLASKLDIEGMRKFVNATTLQFLSIEGLYKSMGYEKRNMSYPQFTDHYFTGEYPIDPIDAKDKDFINDQPSLMSEKY